MLNSLISRNIENWFQRSDCPARSIVEHIRRVGFFRDAQIEAIKTYLYLKIEGGNRPLWQLFSDGFLTSGEDLSRLPISQRTREIFEEKSAARALYEFSRSKEPGSAKTLLPELEKYLGEHAAEADYERIIKSLFYGVEYSDYLFSLPMGAGKTFLMAAFIYLDLYFAQNEPNNKTWAHNFILLVPSGLKSSILPSLKTIENFDPIWVLPEPAASNVKKLIRFEMLNQPKSGNKSNKTRNPNAVKVSSHQPFADLMGLVMVTNAEKVVLDRVQISAQGSLIEQSDDEKDKYANELRNLISKIPNLQILIDEVHHAATDDIKLRQVVNNWSKSGNINGVLGFSGTPYLASPETVRVANDVSLKFSQITNTVFYYPLTRAIEGFLKKPKVRTISEVQSNAIVRRGVEDFLAEYGAKLYSGGETAKLGIYCGTIERLEEEIYPMLLEMHIPPDDILKFHRGNKQHPAPAGAENEWKMLDTNLSSKRIILLVQIGKEGWDCRSLTGVILSQKGDCPTNMVLQTSCRCLRQMDGIAFDGRPETAGIWLNSDNAKTLDKQLREEQHTSIQEINNLGKSNRQDMRPRFSRMDRLKLPPVEFYQMRIQYDTQTLHEAMPKATIQELQTNQFLSKAEIVTSGLQTSQEVSRRFVEEEHGEITDFQKWLLHISKGSFGAVSLSALRNVEIEIRQIFDIITYDDRGVRRFNELYDEAALASRIRLAFYAHRTMNTKCDIIREEASLLIVSELKEIASNTKYLYPGKTDTDDIVDSDNKGLTSEEYADSLREDIRLSLEEMAAKGRNRNLFSAREVELGETVKNKDRSFQYIPYHFDSSFEEEFLKQALTFETIKNLHLELYFNGEGKLTQFRIECFARAANGWSRVGFYTPDFLLVERKSGEIHRALIIETKGLGFAKDFEPRRKFVETEWLKSNEEKFGYRKFEFLYLEGDMNAETRNALETKVKEFFSE